MSVIPHIEGASAIPQRMKGLLAFRDRRDHEHLKIKESDPSLEMETVDKRVRQTLLSLCQ